MKKLDDITIRELELERARISFWHFCNLLYPKFFKKERTYLREFCGTLEHFVLDSDKPFCVINLPPRHGKSFVAQCLTAWILGLDPLYRIMTGSYNEDLSGTFSKTVRNLIQTEKVGDAIVYSDIFPETRIKYGDAQSKRWATEAQAQTSYLATSPNGTATGFGCDFLICDDLIKNAEDAYNENTLESIWKWFTDTMLSRLEGKRKTIIIMTRWAEKDLAGHILEAFGDQVELIIYRAETDGKMLCDEILDRNAYGFLKREMSLDILEANYNQTPVDVQGRLYREFKEWETLPTGSDGGRLGVLMNYTDTADTGSDYLCSINYLVYEKEAYVTDLVFTNEPMEVTEPAVAELFYSGDVSQAVIESNNGGRGFARNVGDLLRQKYQTNRTTITPQTQSKNKISRILTSSAWVQNHVYMPLGWRQRFPEFYKQVMNYQRKGKNAHDDAVDVLAAIFESITARGNVVVMSSNWLDGGGEDYRGPFE